MRTNFSGSYRVVVWCQFQGCCASFSSAFPEPSKGLPPLPGPLLHRMEERGIAFERLRGSTRIGEVLGILSSLVLHREREWITRFAFLRVGERRAVELQAISRHARIGRVG